MGICFKAKDIVTANNISNVPVDKDEKNNNNEQNNDNEQNNNLNNNLLTNEEKVEENFNQKVANTEENDKEKRKSKVKLKFKNNNSIKKVSFQSTNEFDSDGNNKNNSNVGRKRGKSAMIKEISSKFQRNSRKSATLINNNILLHEKLRTIEMKIPVIQQTLITQKFGDPDKYYKKIKDLGSGSYGSVYKAKNLVMDNIVAIKMIEKVQENMIDDLEIKNEVNILKTLSHPNIVKIYEFFDTAIYYYIVTEYCKNGELFSYITNLYNETQLSVLFYQVFSGLCYLHEKKILHRDLKLENLMVSEKEKDIATGEEYFWIKIIDFGTAKIFQKNKTEKTVIGSSYYIAPEVLRQKYNEKCDTWSVGVILFMTLAGFAPFDGDNDEEIIRRIKLGKYNKNDQRYVKHSQEVKDLVSKLLEKNIDKRLSAKEALNHPWFEKYGGRNLFCNFKPEEIRPYIDNLFNYKYNSKLQELVLAFLVHNLSNNDQTLIILKMFRYFNKSGDCKLTKLELTQGLYSYKDKSEVDEMVDVIFGRLDGDNNGFIEYEEFLRACIDKKSLMTKENLKYAFKFLDKDNTKTLNANKILKAFLTKPNKEFEAIFNITLKEVDKDSDGIINFEEFLELMSKIQ